MNPEAQNQPPQPTQQAAPPTGPGMRNPLETMQPGEQVIFQIKRHPIGMFGLYVIFGLLLITIAAIAFAIAPSLFPNADRSQIVNFGVLAFMVAAVFSLVFLFIANKVYWGNAWILTSDSITQVTQTSLFNKQSSQLSLNNLEDVTAEQNGILTHMFNYGVLKAETAGERSKFSFFYCPNPNFYAQKVLQAREAFEQAGRYQAEQYQQGPPPGSGQFPASSTMGRQPPHGSGVNINTNK